jgi:L-ribulose-5-phosphate 4-epimerase
MKPAGIGLEEMTPESIITVDIDGNKIDGSMARHNEVFIHSEIYRHRPDVQSVVHTHAPYAVAFSSLGRELLPISNDAGFFYKRLEVFSETTDLIIDPERGKSVAKHLGNNSAVLLRNHGIVTAGGSIEEAVWLAVRLERACQCQLLTEAAGGPRLLVDASDLEKKNKRGTRPDNYNNVFSYLVRCWCREHGTPNDLCCSEANEIDVSGYKN